MLIIYCDFRKNGTFKYISTFQRIFGTFKEKLLDHYLKNKYYLKKMGFRRTLGVLMKFFEVSEGTMLDISKKIWTSLKQN